MFGHEVMAWAHDQSVKQARIEREARDRAWIERNLGDVPYDRVIGATCHDNPMAWKEAAVRDSSMVRSTDGTLGRLARVMLDGG